jgi:hypothetical protein
MFQLEKSTIGRGGGGGGGLGWKQLGYTLVRRGDDIQGHFLYIQINADDQ